MRKVTSTTIVFIIIMVLPLIGAINLMTRPTFFIVAFFFYLLHFTQPTFKFLDAKEHAETDRFSMILILFSLTIVLSGSIIDWAYFQEKTSQFQFGSAKTIGLVLMILGSSIRIWAIRHLGQYFTNSVQFEQKHQLIQTGPYGLVRHPSYLGAYLAVIGTTLFLESGLFFMLGSILMFIAYQYRIKVEEKGLVAVFGESYESYKGACKQMIPFLY